MPTILMDWVLASVIASKLKDLTGFFTTAKEESGKAFAASIAKARLTTIF